MPLRGWTSSSKETRFAELFAIDEQEQLTRAAVNVDGAPQPLEAD